MSFRRVHTLLLLSSFPYTCISALCAFSVKQMHYVSQQHSAHLFAWPRVHIFISGTFFSLLDNASFGRRNARQNCRTRDELLAMINERCKEEKLSYQSYGWEVLNIICVTLIALHNKILSREFRKCQIISMQHCARES